LILTFPLNKRSQRTNHLRYLLFPLTKIQRINRLRILCPNTLEGTSFVVQVKGTSTWGLLYSTWLFKENKGGYIPCGSLACKEFYKLERNLKNRLVAWGLDVGTDCGRTIINLVFVLFFPTLFNFRYVLLIIAFTFGEVSVLFFTFLTL